MLGVKGSVKYQMDSFHLAYVTQRLILLQMMLVDCAYYYIQQVIWVFADMHSLCT